MEPFPLGLFGMLHYFETVLPSVEVCDVTKHGHHVGFYQALEVR